jgi:hypothetical protein
MSNKNWRELFEKDELEWFLELGRAKHDPEEKKTFFDGVVERKRADPKWNLFEAYPREVAKAEEKPVDPAQDMTACQVICQEIIDGLRSSGAKSRREREQEGA